VSISSASSVDLSLEQQQPDLPGKRTGETIQLGASQVISAQTIILIVAQSISDRRFAIGRRMLTVFRAFAAVDGSLVGSRLVDVAVRRRLISVKGRTVAVTGRLISIGGPLVGRGLGSVAIGSIVVAVCRGLLAVIGSAITV
jgi:hypothetical protein